MIGLDTSVLVRYITGDDRVWSKAATRFIDTQCTAERAGYINPIVLAEVVWVLRRRPEFSRERLANLIDELLDADNFVVERAEAVERALEVFLRTGAGFADCLIAELNKDAGAIPTYAIDKDAVRDKVFEQLEKR